jgi:uncharacterized membrane protein
MTEKGLKRLLIASLAVNLFLVGASVGGAVVAMRAFEDRVTPRTPPPPPVMEAAKSLNDTNHARLREVMREAALDAAPDFKAARQARRRAVELAKAPTFDRDAVAAEIESARAAEIRGRRRLEGALLGFMTTLDAGERAKLAPVLQRLGLKGKMKRPDERGGPDGQPQSAAQP